MSVDYGHCNYFFEKIINVRSVDQMRKRYDFKIKGVKVFAACNEITKLPKPLQSRFRRLHLPAISNSNFYKYQPRYVKFPSILGIECVGIAEAAQPYTGIMVGQPVAALMGGMVASTRGYAEYTLVPAEHLFL